jgi:cell shape-determining protein MreC
MTEQVPTYEQLKLENERLKAQLFQQQREQQQQQLPPDDQEYPLSLDEYARYGRQMIVPQFGIKGMLFVIY